MCHPLRPSDRRSCSPSQKQLDKGSFHNYHIIIKFEWNTEKAEINIKKHGVSFEEASSVFYDDNALMRDDPDHSEEEDRFIILGLSEAANILVVCHCYRMSDEIIRIISARKATRQETNQYNERG